MGRKRRADGADFSPHRDVRLPEERQCLVQIQAFKSHPWCSIVNLQNSHSIAWLLYSALFVLFYSSLLNSTLADFGLVYSTRFYSPISYFSRDMPTGLDDFLANDHVNARNSEFLYETSSDNVCKYIEFLLRHSLLVLRNAAGALVCAEEKQRIPTSLRCGLCLAGVRALPCCKKVDETGCCRGKGDKLSTCWHMI